MKVYKENGTKERLFEMFENVNKIKLNESEMWGEKINNESFDSPIEKDKKYLDKTVGVQSSQVSKYDDGTRYPVEDKFKVNDPSLEGLKGDDAPIKETFEDDLPKHITDDPNYNPYDPYGDGQRASEEEEAYLKMQKDKNLEEDDADKSDEEEMLFSSEGETSEDGENVGVEIDKPAWDENFGGEESGLPEEELELEAPEGDNGFEDQIEGGIADDAQPSDFNPEQIAKGIQIEMEHTNDPQKALEIAMDHLTEIPDYYDRLESMEAEAKGENGMESEDGNPEDTLLDPSKHWVNDYSPSNVTDEAMNYPHPTADPEVGEEEYEEMEKLKNNEL